MANLVVWCDIPVLDLDRAIRFYSQVISVEIRKDVPHMPMGVFVHGPSDVSGCLHVNENHKPSAQGPLLYFNVNGRLDAAVAEVQKCGGEVLEPKHSIQPYGFRTIVLDSEGNRIALHSETA
jgi:uncharacterized protein